MPDQTFIGTNGNDTITGTDGIDLLDGGLGNDRLSGGLGTDLVYGGEGDDVLYEQRGEGDSLYGGAGNDRLYNESSATFAVIDGGDGDDLLDLRSFNGASVDLLDGGAGRDTLRLTSSTPDMSRVTNVEVLELSSSKVVLVDANAAAGTTLFVRSIPSSGVNWVDASAETDAHLDIQGSNYSLGADDLRGGQLADTIRGLAGHDLIMGNGGDDILNGGYGDDRLYGGDGVDTAIFLGRRDQYTITEVRGGLRVSGLEGTDTLFGIERLQFTDQTYEPPVLPNQTLIGDENANELWGGQGDDVIEGRAGDDILDGLEGADTLKGEDGRDHLVGGEGDDSLYGGVGGDELWGGEGADHLYGGDGDDTLVDNSGANVMDGGAGDDTFYTPGWNAGDKGSGGGVDTLTGGAGRDTYHLSAHYARQAPTLFHVDIITDFAAGSDGDVLDLTNVVGYLEGYTSGNPYETGHLRVVADGTDTLVQMDWTGSGVDQSYVTLIRLQNVQPSDLTRYNLGVPPVSILGTSGDDTLVGTAYSDVFEGYDGNDTAVFLGNRDQYVVTVELGYITVSGSEETDTLYGIERLQFADTVVFLSSDGNDSLTGGTGDDAIAAGGGDDAVSGGAGNDSIDGETGDDSLSGDEGNDSLTGGEGADSLDGGTGNDVLDGGEGNDWLLGGDGDDTVTGGSGNDSLKAGSGAGNDSYDGGADVDTIIYSSTTLGVAVDLASGRAYGKEVDQDIILNVENVIGGSGNDALGGNEVQNTLSGGGGQDILFGAAGDDLLNGGSGADRLIGGIGLDTVTYADATAGVRADLGSSKRGLGDAAGDTFEEVENVVGSSFADELLGSSANNRLEGGAGNDVLDGLAGDDRVVGGSGNDTLNAASGNDVFIFASGFGSDTISSFDFNPAKGQDLLDISAFGISRETFADRVKMTDLGADILVTIDGQAEQTIRLSNAQLASNVAVEDFIL